MTGAHSQPELIAGQRAQRSVPRQQKQEKQQTKQLKRTAGVETKNHQAAPTQREKREKSEQSGSFPKELIFSPKIAILFTMSQGSLTNSLLFRNMHSSRRQPTKERTTLKRALT
jgi:hypothetical protein